ncbi:MAG: GntR family transcriptional regulator [Firmicutes bacterium]|nr:GntR family transcriptional regulator [Bacillota bacterium]
MKTKVHSLRRFTLRRQIYEAVKEQILNQSLPAGTRIMEDEIAREFGVSRTPVREAMSQLEMDGLVRVEPRRGIFVTEVTDKRMMDICDVREVLEELAVRKAATKANSEQVKTLRQINEEYARSYAAEEYADCIALDRKFHESLASIAGNEKLIEFIEDISNLVQMTRFMDCRRPENIEATLSEHNAIVDALAANDVDAAVAAIRKHLQRVRDNLISSSRSLALAEAEGEESADEGVLAEPENSVS